jgi:hypothetical protein
VARRQPALRQVAPKLRPAATPATRPPAMPRRRPARRPAQVRRQPHNGRAAQPPLQAINQNLRRLATGPAMWQNPLLQRQSRPCRGFKSTCWVSLPHCWR